MSPSPSPPTAVSSAPEELDPAEWPDPDRRLLPGTEKGEPPPPAAWRLETAAVGGESEPERWEALLPRGACWKSRDLSSPETVLGCHS